MPGTTTTFTCPSVRVAMGSLLRCTAVLLVVAGSACSGPRPAHHERPAESVDEPGEGRPARTAGPGAAAREPGDSVPNSQAVGALLREAFGGVVEFDSAGGGPRFRIGDFDGDGRRDLAATARVRSVGGGVPAPPDGVCAYNPMGTGMAPFPERPAREALRRMGGEAVEVVIHDFRNPAPRARFILLFRPWEDMRFDLFRGAVPFAVGGDEPEPIPPPRLRGDAILLHGGGDGAVLYWDGERYRWYPYGPAQDQ